MKPQRWLDSAATVRAPVIEALGRLDLGEDDVWAAAELARVAPDADPERRRAFAHLVLAVLAGERRGSTRLPLGGDGLPVVLDDLALDDDERRAVMQLVEQLRRAPSAVLPMIGGPDDYRPLIVEGDHLYTQRGLALERRVAGLLRARLGRPPPAPEAGRAARIDGAIADVLADPPEKNGKPVRLSDEQRAALQLALLAPLAVVSGGPGTGKTSIVVSLLRALARTGDPPLESVALAAPTGKAADRMRQSVSQGLRRLRAPALADRALLTGVPEAWTLHRLLGYSPRSGRFRHHEGNPLSHRLVIVDESSMVDLALMDRLLRALADDARLVLLGDARQLPSVEAGAVFRDLCARGAERVVVLTRSYRLDPEDPAGRNILSVALRIDAGDGEGLVRPHAGSPGVRGERLAIREAPSEVKLSGAELVEAVSARAREAVLERWEQLWLERMPELDTLAQRSWPVRDGRVGAEAVPELEHWLACFERFRVLCLTQGRATGVEAINAWFRDRAAARVGLEVGSDALLPAEPVLVRRNDYERRLFNGDQGLVIRSASGDGVVVRREGALVVHPVETVRFLVEPAWASTVHKAQGSEHDHVMVVLPDGDTPLLTRELLYTGVTRARKSVLLVGSRAILERGVRTTVRRFSGVADRLAAP